MTSLPGPPSLSARTAAVVAMVADSYRDSPAADAVDAIATRLNEPLRVAIAGKAKAGKSTLLNALVGEVVAPTDATECTRVVTWYREGRLYRAEAELASGGQAEIEMRRHATGVELDLGGRPPESVTRILVEWPTSALRRMTLIDTPGVGSLSAAGDRTMAFLDPDDERGSPVDAVVYLTGHVHRSELAFLEPFHDNAGGRASPVNAVAVLSRADEIGGGRPDALASAASIAARSRADAAMRRLCQTVVPLAGLLAQAAVTLTEAEYRALHRLANAPIEIVDGMLLSVDRFSADAADGTGLAAAERMHLLERLGLFGVRLACELLRGGRAASARTLAEELRRRSGLDELRHLLMTRFAARSEMLKARSALLALDDVLRRWPPENGSGSALRAELERVQSSAHELAELRVLVALRAGMVPLDEEATEELERLLELSDPSERLGVAPGDAGELRAAIVDGVGRWRGRAEHPLAPPAVVEASQVAVHTLERILAASGQRPGS